MASSKQGTGQRSSNKPRSSNKRSSNKRSSNERRSKQSNSNQQGDSIQQSPSPSAQSSAEHPLASNYSSKAVSDLGAAFAVQPNTIDQRGARPTAIASATDGKQDPVEQGKTVLPVEHLRKSLLDWYGLAGRTLPWRNHPDPYAVWISEIMLQQTQVKTVLPYFQRWMEQFPTVESLAMADQTAVLKQWEGLGYYARARNLHRTAQIVAEQYGGQFPSRFDEVIALPGIGRTTAGGILSSAFNQPVAILDGNVKRVLARLIALERPPAKAMDELWALSEALIDPAHPRDFNQALMDLGATLCTAKNPACLICPWRSPNPSFTCAAYNLGTQSELPMRESKRPLPHKIIGVAVIWNEQDLILIDRRPQKGLLGGLWEFPGGKLEQGETLEDCVVREVKEELAIDISVGEKLMTLDHAYSHFKVTLNVFACRHVAGEPQTIECDEVRWVTLEELDQYPFPKANSKIIEMLKARAGED